MITATCLTLALSADAASAQSPLRQVGSHGDAGCEIRNPSANSAGDLIAFESNCDLTGGNGDGNREIFQAAAAGGFTQLTDTVTCANANPSSNATGDTIAFDSDCDFGAGAGDLGLTAEIYTVSSGGAIDQLTDHGSFDNCESVFPSINAAGDAVAYDSNCDPLGTNFDRSNEIFTVSTSGTTVQLTDDDTMTGCGSFNASANAVGDAIAFEGDCDLTGGNEDEIPEIFKAEIDGSDVAVLQLTLSEDDSCYSGLPVIDDAGVIVAFESSCDFTGANGDGGVEIFRLSGTGAAAQISNSASSDCDSFGPDINGSGIRIVYTSFCDPVGANADGGLEVFAATTSSTEQLTDGASCWNFSPALGFGVGSTTFVGDCDPNDDNADGSQELFQSDRTQCGACGAPLSGKDWPLLPVASDALFVLQASVGLSTCPLCECDVDASGLVSASDALRVLRSALGTGMEPICS